MLEPTSMASLAPVPVSLSVTTDWTAVVFALVLSCASSLVFGFLPALRSSRVVLAGVMKDDLSPRGGSRGRLRNVLVVSQVAVSLLLLVGAALVGSVLVTPLLASLLYGVSPTDAVSFALAAAVVLTTVLVASFVPAWRASRTDPIAALRHR